MKTTASHKLANDVVLDEIPNEDLVELKEVLKLIKECVEFALSFGDDMDEERTKCFNNTAEFLGSLRGRFDVELELRKEWDKKLKT